MRSLFVAMVVALCATHAVIARVHHRTAKRHIPNVVTSSASTAKQRNPADAGRSQDQIEQPRVLTDGMGRH